MNRSHRSHGPNHPPHAASHVEVHVEARVGLVPLVAVVPLLVVMLALVATGCGGNLTAGGARGEATVTVSGDAEPEPSAAAVPARSDHHLDDDDDNADEAEGEIEAELRLFLITDDGTEIELTDSAVEVDVDVQGREEMDAVHASVPAHTYTGLRVVFTELEVEVESGLILNGLPFVGQIDVELDEGTLTVDKPLELVVQSGATARILVDLNARTWLLSADPLLGVVAEGIVADAISVRTL